MQWLKSLLGLRDDHADLFSPVPPNPAQDALAAIDALSRAIQNHHGAVEVCTALGNLYRMRGELDRAIQMRSSLQARDDLSREDQTRIWFELGRDYSRAGMLDRAGEALRRCREIGGDHPALALETALLHAKGGDFMEASRQYMQMGARPPGRPLPGPRRHGRPGCGHGAHRRGARDLPGIARGLAGRHHAPHTPGGLG